MVGMGNEAAVEAFDAVIHDVRWQATQPIQTRTLTSMRLVMQSLARERSIGEAAKEAGVTKSTVEAWRKRYPAFGEWARVQVLANRKARIGDREAKRRVLAEEAQLVVSDDPAPDRGSLTEFRLKYFGRPTPEHQQLAVEALEDQTNLYVFVFGPPGMGKDTLAGDYCAWEAAPDRTGKTVAWFMESGDFSERRMGRLDQYLTDPKSYAKPPSKTPGGQKPSGSLIDDYGPFKWKPGMEWSDGTPVQKKRWTAHAKYFVRVDAPEQDPNLWATGIEGATYGSRIKVCVLSDAFTLENQVSPTTRMNGYAWVTGTLDTRLDDDGRLVVIGTILPSENNYQRLEADYTAGARVVHQKTLGTSTLTKFSNGVAVIRVQAVGVTPEGEEVSFWPEMFPLDDTYHYKGKRYLADSLTTQRIAEVAAGGGRLRRGLRGRRARQPDFFEAMYQQTHVANRGGDFTGDVLDMCKDETRSFGQTFAHELRVVGVDPARRYGAGWVLLAVDRRNQTVTLADFFFGSELGYQGIKQRLVLEPLQKWSPMWYGYEDNKEGAVLEDPLIREAIDATGVSVYTHSTGRERNIPDVGPGSVSQYMRSGQFRIPYATAADRGKFETVKAHFLAWDSAFKRTKPGQSGHSPDELCMATWVAGLKAFPLLVTTRKDFGLTAYMPVGLRRRYDRTMKDLSARTADTRRGGRARSAHVTVEDAVAAMLETTE